MVIRKVRGCTPGLVLNVTGIEYCAWFVVPGTRPNVAPGVPVSAFVSTFQVTVLRAGVVVSGVAVAKTSIVSIMCSTTMSPVAGWCTTSPLIVMFGDVTMPLLLESPVTEVTSKMWRDWNEAGTGCGGVVDVSIRPLPESKTLSSIASKRPTHRVTEERTRLRRSTTPQNEIKHDTLPDCKNAID